MKLKLSLLLLLFSTSIIRFAAAQSAPSWHVTDTEKYKAVATRIDNAAIAFFIAKTANVSSQSGNLFVIDGSNIFQVAIVRNDLFMPEENDENLAQETILERHYGMPCQS